MKTYIRFENGKQVEVTILETRPIGENWKIAPKNFDFKKAYRLTASGAIEEVPEEVLKEEQLASSKEIALVELSRLVENARSKYIGNTPTKQKCYELQEKAAQAVLDDSNSSLGNLIKPLADVREISITEMAELILEKSTLANQKIIAAEAIEDEYQILIEEAENSLKLAELLSEVSIKTEGF